MRFISLNICVALDRVALLFSTSVFTHTPAARITKIPYYPASPHRVALGAAGTLQYNPHLAPLPHRCAESLEPTLNPLLPPIQ